MKKAKNKPLQALLTISSLALAAFVLMALIIPVVTDRLLQDKDPLNMGEPASIVGATANAGNTEQTSGSSLSEYITDPVEPSNNPTHTAAVTPTMSKSETETDTADTASSDTSAPTGTEEDISDVGNDQKPSETDPEATDPVSDLPVSYLSDERVKEIFQKYSQMVASIQVYLPGTDSTNDKMAIFSGLIISADGQVITFGSNFSFALSYGHRLYERAEVRIVVPGRQKSFEATLEGIQRDTDLALFQIEDISDLTFATLDSESKLSIGDPVIAIGQNDVLTSKGGLFPGLITAIYHPMVLENNIKIGMIQTSAFISQQASGGPLINLAGDVIGLNNSQLNRTYSDIMGYAIPTPVLKTAMDIITNPDPGPREPIGWLGIITLPDDENENLLELMDWPSGLYISGVEDSSPSSIAGIKSGDILMQVNGVNMHSHDTYAEYIQGKPVGTLVHVRIYRTSEQRFISLQIYLGRMP
jgi:S1-C subfamily serine protease